MKKMPSPNIKVVTHLEQKVNIESYLKPSGNVRVPSGNAKVFRFVKNVSGSKGWVILKGLPAEHADIDSVCLCMQNSWYANSQATSSVDPKIPFMNTAIPKTRCRRKSKKASRQDRKVIWVAFFKKIKDASYNNTNINKLSSTLLAIH